MAYQSLYRKWRPQTFSDIVGQEHITKTLQSEIVSGHVSHAYLFCGSRGTGKTTTAKVFSKAVNCENPVDGNPCNKCRSCTGITNGSITDVFEIDAASHTGVDDIRTINTESSYLPSGVKYKIYIIDEVHMLSKSAFNALLKTLEEPPEHVIFILATTESDKILPTILSRCQRFDFRYISDAAMYGRLKTIADAEGFSIDDASLHLIINAAKGGLRDAVSMLDQCSAYDGGRIDDKIVRTVTGALGTELLIKMGNAILSHDIETLLKLARSAVSGGYDASRLLESLMEHLRNIIVAEGSSSPRELIDLSESDTASVLEQARNFGTVKALSALEVLMTAYETIRWSQNPTLIAEAALIKIAHPKADKSYDALLKRIEALEARPQKAVQAVETFEEEEEEYVADIPDEEELEYDIPPMPIEEPKPEIPKSGTDSIPDMWDEILVQLEKDAGALIAMAVRSGSFRVSANRLVICGVVQYLQNNENKAAIRQAVKDINGADVEVVFENEEPVSSDLSGAGNDNDPLAALASKLDGKINIIS